MITRPIVRLPLLLAATLVLPLSGVQASDSGSLTDKPADNASQPVRIDLPLFTADYELQRNNTRAAQLTRSISCAGDVCEFRSEGQTVGFLDLILRGRIEEWTQFRLTKNGIEPLEYFYRQRARGGNDEFRRLFFSPSTGRVSSRGDDVWDLQVEGEAMDQLLSQLRLMQAVRAGETEMSFSVVDEEGDVDKYNFKVVGSESISTSAGTFDTVRVERVRGSNKRKTTMWFAPELEHMPIRIRHERVGRETFTATLTGIRKAP